MTQAQSYRPEIDGLRAVAVLPVILFHAGVGFLSGGYLGVDVFFVISGYLITSILIKELQADNFSVLNFYDRRARRILPALFVVMLFTLPFAWALMPPDGLQLYFRSLPATAWFLSNVHFYQSQGYFNPDAELQPLLHTWSLAVEEQFYLAFPLLLSLLWWFSKRVGVWLAALAAAGFCICLLQLSVNQNAAFYLPHARIWELLAGAVLAVAQAKPSRLEGIPGTSKEIIVTVSVVALFACFVAIDETWSTPGFPNLLVVLATVALLAFANPQNLVGKVLASRPLVAVGLISYSAYLWHHPLFAFARLGSLKEPAVSLMLALAVLSLLLAYLSWRWIEQPLRKREVVQRGTIFSAALVFMLVSGVGGYFAVETNLSTASYTAEQLALVRPALSKADNCVWTSPINGHPDIKLCALGTGAADGPIVLWGDSHAAALKDQLSLALAKKGRNGYYLSSSPCLRIPRIMPTSRIGLDDVAKCTAIQAAMFTFLTAQRPSAIVVNMRWTLRLFPVTGAQDTVGFDNGEGGIESEDRRINWVQDANGQWSTADEMKTAAILNFLDQLTRACRQLGDSQII